MFPAFLLNLTSPSFLYKRVCLFSPNCNSISVLSGNFFSESISATPVKTIPPPMFDLFAVFSSSRIIVNIPSPMSYSAIFSPSDESKTSSCLLSTLTLSTLNGVEYFSCLKPSESVTLLKTAQSKVKDKLSPSLISMPSSIGSPLSHC